MAVTDFAFGRAVEYARDAAHLGQQDLAERLRARGLNWSRVTVSKVETGNRTVKASELPILADALGTEVHDLFSTAEDALKRGFHQAHRQVAFIRAQRWQLEQVADDVQQRIDGVLDQERGHLNTVALFSLLMVMRDDIDRLVSVNWSKPQVVEFAHSAIEAAQQDLLDWLEERLETADQVRFGTSPQDDRLSFDDGRAVQ